MTDENIQQKLLVDNVRLQTQLGCCGLAAQGYITGEELCKPNSYGWSPSYKYVLELRQAYDDRMRQRTAVILVAIWFAIGVGCGWLAAK